MVPRQPSLYLHVTIANDSYDAISLGTLHVSIVNDSYDAITLGTIPVAMVSRQRSLVTKQRLLRCYVVMASIISQPADRDPYFVSSLSHVLRDGVLAVITWTLSLGRRRPSWL